STCSKITALTVSQTQFPSFQIGLPPFYLAVHLLLDNLRIFFSPAAQRVAPGKSAPVGRDLFLQLNQLRSRLQLQGLSLALHFGGKSKEGPVARLGLLGAPTGMPDGKFLPTFLSHTRNTPF
ncbi:MAG: hypothetical protein DMG05_09775, partial [Acidobacteria bacterium]